MTVNMKAPLEIGISVKDVDRAADFYERVLGFQRMSEATLAADRAALAGFGPVAFRMVRMQTNYGERIKLLKDLTPLATSSSYTEVNSDRVAYQMISMMRDVVQRGSGAVVDFELVRQGRRTLVSARRWKSARIGLEALRALHAAGHEIVVIHPGQFRTRPCPGYAGIDIAVNVLTLVVQLFATRWLLPRQPLHRVRPGAK